MSAAHTIPKKGGGGPILSEAEEKDLVYWLDRKRADLANSRYPDRDQEWIAAAEAELRARGVEPSRAPKSDAGASGQRVQPAGGSRQAPSPNEATKNFHSTKTFHDPQELLTALETIEKDYNLVGVVAVGEIPEGHSVIMTVIPVPSAQFFKTDNGFGLSGNAISRIADAAGVSCVESRQIEYDPHGMCGYGVRVQRQELSGALRSHQASGKVELRPGTSEFEVMLKSGEDRRSKAIREKWENIPDPMGQIRAKWKNLPALAESKAYLRAVRKLLSLDRSYTDKEKLKPFVVFRLAFTGRSHDPELRKMFARGLMNAALGGNSALYGGSVMAQLPTPRAVPLLASSNEFPSYGDDDDFDRQVDAVPRRPAKVDEFEEMEQPYPATGNDEDFPQ